MPMVDADWSVDRTTGNIRYIGDDHGGASPSYATVIEFHRWLQDLADDASSVGDDELDITDLNPSSRSTDNIITLLGTYNIDDITSEHLFDGSIIQSNGAEIYDGIVNFGNADVQIQIIQNGAVLADDWWNFGGGGLNASAAAGISHRFMIKTRTGGADIDGRRLIGTCRRFGFTYSEFSINGTARGNNVLALSDSADLNNATLEATVATYDQFSNTEAYSLLDVDNNGTPEPYYSNWDIGVGATPSNPSINDFYEYAKWLSRDGSASTLYGLSGELFRGVTHQITYTGLTGTIDEANPVTFANGATAQVLADNGVDTMWVQLLTGVAPSNSDSITQSAPDAASATVNVVTDRSALISTPFVGQSTGSAIIGTYGVGITPTDLTQNDSLVSLDGGAPLSPPNFVTFSVGGLVASEDRVLVGPWDGVTNDNQGNPEVDYNQLTISGTLTTDNVASITVTTAIPTDTPSTGFIRVEDNNGFYRRIAYSSYSGSTFTVDTAYHTTPDANNPGNDTANDFLAVGAGTTGTNVFIAYVDHLYDGTSNTNSFTGVYLADRDLVVKVRDGGGSPIREFISSASLGTTGGSITAIRTSDS